VTSVPPPSGYDPPAPQLTRPELPDGLPPGRVPPDEPPPSPRDELPAWPPWAPFAAMLITLGLAILGVSIAALVAELAGFDVSAGDPPPGVTIAGTFVQDGALIFAALLLARMTAGRPTAAQFGLRRVAPRRALGWLLATWVTFIVFSGIWAAALGIEENDDLPQELGADDSTTALAAVAVLVCVAAPIAEELFFRGFCFTAFRRWIGVLPGALATGVIFGLIHAGSADAVFLVPLAIFGALLCLLYHRSGSLLPCIVLHALNNSLALGVSQGWSFAEVLALMAGASAAVLAISVPFARPATVGSGADVRT
jgi:membrane protease YdiL (CAAX protease family)